MKDERDRGTESPNRSNARSMDGSATLPRPPRWRPPPTPPMPPVGGTRRRRTIVVVAVPAIVVVLIGAFAVRSASTETDVVRHASTGRAPPTELALDKMTEAMLWAWNDGERREFMRQDIQRVMRCSPVEWLHREIDVQTPEALEAFKDDQLRFVERFVPAEGFLIGAAKRSRISNGVERLAIAWRCAAG
jgi:hypothetical protein